MKGARDIPLYRATYKLLMGVDKIQGGMTKDRKHTIGRRMMDIVLDMINYLRFAVDMPEERKKYILLYLGKYDQVATLLKMSEEKGYIRKSDYVGILKDLANVERQAMGWYKKLRVDQPESECLNDIPSELCE